MVGRTTRRGPNRGDRFWGCPEFPRCRGIIKHKPPVEEAPAWGEAPARNATPAELPGRASGLGNEDAPTAERSSPAPASSPEKPQGILAKVARVVDKGYRWYLETGEPDATGRWDKGHRNKMLSYVYNRDGGRCGLCAGEMKMKGAQVEHIVPKVFAVFDVRRGGRAREGSRYKSRLHGIDNLQAAHSYCNKRKGNTPVVSRWRHPAMPQLTVADTEDGSAFVLPWKPPSRPAG